MIAVHDYQLEVILHLNRDQHLSPQTKAEDPQETLDMLSIFKNKHTNKKQNITTSPSVVTCLKSKSYVDRKGPFQLSHTGVQPKETFTVFFFHMLHNCLT